MRRRIGSTNTADLVCPPQVRAIVIQHAVWLYMRFTLSYRDMEDLLAERGVDSPTRRSGARC